MEKVKFCNRCKSLGVLRVQNQDQFLDSLVICNCDWGKQQKWNLPVINEKIEKAFEVSNCPREWYMPDNKFGSTPIGSILHSISPKIEQWKQKLAKAELFWSTWGLIFNPDEV